MRRYEKQSTHPCCVTDPEIRSRIKARMEEATRKREAREADARRRWSKSKARYWHISATLTPNPNPIVHWPPFLRENPGLTWYRQTAPRNHSNMRRGA